MLDLIEKIEERCAANVQSSNNFRLWRYVKANDNNIAWAEADTNENSSWKEWKAGLCLLFRPDGITISLRPRHHVIIYAIQSVNYKAHIFTDLSPREFRRYCGKRAIPN
jgi:hypothetical protein